MSISKRVRRAGRGGVWTMTLLTAALSAWSCQPVGEPPEAVEAVLTPPREYRRRSRAVIRPRWS